MTLHFYFPQISPGQSASSLYEGVDNDCHTYCGCAGKVKRRSWLCDKRVEEYVYISNCALHSQKGKIPFITHSIKRLVSQLFSARGTKLKFLEKKKKQKKA